MSTMMVRSSAAAMVGVCAGEGCGEGAGRRGPLRGPVVVGTAPLTALLGVVLVGDSAAERVGREGPRPPPPASTGVRVGGRARVTVEVAAGGARVREAEVGTRVAGALAGNAVPLAGVCVGCRCRWGEARVPFLAEGGRALLRHPGVPLAVGVVAPLALAALLAREWEAVRWGVSSSTLNRGVFLHTKQACQVRFKLLFQST